MASFLPPVIQLSEYDSSEFFLLQSRPPGTYTQKGELRGNSILSSIFVEAIDPGTTIQVNYYDTTTGASVTPAERYDLESHTLVDDTSAGETFRIIVPRIHHRVVAEAIVVGGTAKFSVYATVINSAVSDIDNALIRDGDTFEQPTDRAIPVAYLDEDTGLLNFLRGNSNGIKVDGTFSESGLVTPVNETVLFPVANLEQTYNFPSNTKHFFIKNETRAVILLSWQSGESATNYFKLIPGAVYQSPEKPISAVNISVYLQASSVVSAPSGLKVVSWS